ncbi:hypothetical protein FQN55_002831 [Onygenales sp. PD_40]|nr:hypothetical protein FQN55_002831 [Onygenales sp. PD_40]
MDEFTAEAFVNRDEPIPVIQITPRTSDDSPRPAEKDSDSKSRLSARRLRDKLYDVGSESKAKAESAGLSLQDRLLARLLQQIIPAGESDDPDISTVKKPSTVQIERPGFSLPVMSNNFRRFNARIGIVFLFQVRATNVLTWKTPTHTISFLFVYSFLCLDPYLLLILPFAIFLLFIMVPGFLARHPPPPSASTSSTTAYYSYEGPALAPPQTVKPASETSKDFFRNMRDLQNSMADFANLHDATVSLLSPATNFSNETLSSTLFLLFTILAAVLFLTAHLIPWRFLFLIGGNAAIIAANPKVEAFIHNFNQQLKYASAESRKNKPNDTPTTILGTPIPSSPSALMNLLKSAASISLDTYPEEREVEVFELQHKTYSPYSATPEWEPFVFTATPFDPLSPSRIAGDRPRGTRFFEDVRPPAGWEWKGKKWELDLECREWVMERMVTGVEFEIPGGNGGGSGEEVGGWVWDLPFHPPDEDAFEEADDMAYGDYYQSKGKAKAETKAEGKDKGKGKMVKKDWEESLAGVHGAGEWRRRRWVRLVQRISVGDDS